MKQLRKQTQQQGQQRGHTLIELLVLLAVASSLMMVSISWIRYSMKFATAIRLRENQHQNLLRLASHFRHDVQRGISMSFTDDGRLLIEHAANRQVTYQLLATEVVRWTTNEHGQSTQDAFPLAATSKLRWDRQQMPRSVALIVRRGRGFTDADDPSISRHAAAMPVDLIVRSSVGRWPENLEPGP